MTSSTQSDSGFHPGSRATRARNDTAPRATAMAARSQRGADEHCLVRRLRYATSTSPRAARLSQRTGTTPRSKRVRCASWISLSSGRSKKSRCCDNERGRPLVGAHSSRRLYAPPCCRYSTRISWTPAASETFRTCVCMSAGGVRRITSSSSIQTSRRSSPAPCSSRRAASGKYKKPCQRAEKNLRGSVGSPSRKSRVTSLLMSFKRGVPANSTPENATRRMPDRSVKRTSNASRNTARTMAIAA